MNFFRSALYRAFVSWQYLIQLGSALLVSVSSVFLLKMLEQQIHIFPEEMLEVLKIGGNYNIGIVAVPDLHSLNGEVHDDIIRGIFSGSFSHLLIVFIVVSFVCSEYQNGYLRMALMRGQSRIRMCLQYMLISVFMTVPVFLSEFLGVIVSLSMNNLLTLGDTPGTILTLLVQFFMLCSLSICASFFTVMIGKKDAKIFALFAVLSLPIVPRYVYLVTKGEIQIESWILLSQLIKSGNMDVGNMFWNLLLSALTAVCFGVVGIALFCNRNVE